MSLIIIFSIFSLVLWVPVVALLLWAATFISISISFSWIFVVIVAGVASVITGIVWAIFLHAS